MALAADSSILSLSESPAPPSEEKLPLPAYAFNTAFDNAQFTEISNDLFFRDRDSRKVKVFQAMCQHAEQTGNARMYFDTLLRFVLNKGNTGITVELNLHSTLLEVAHTLEEKGYVRIITPPGQADPDMVILQDPVVDKILTYLVDQLGIANRIAVNRGKIPKAGTFPTMTQLTARFDLTPEQSRDLFLSVGATEYEDDFFVGHPGRMVQIHFQEDYSKPFDLVFPTDVDLRSVVKLAVTLLKEFQESNSRYTDEIRSRLNAIPEMNRQPIEPVIQGLLSGNEILADQKYVHWSSVSRQFACGADFLSHPERYVTLEASADSLDTGRYLYVGQAAALVYHYLINSREHLKKKQWEKEAEYNDRKKLFHFLIEECRSRVNVTSPGGLSVLESVFYPVGLDTLQAQNDSSGQMTFKEKYTDTRLQEILRVEGDDVVPQVVRLTVEDKPIFFHRFRLIDVVYAACSSEHNSLKKKLVQEWAGMSPRDVPKRKDFKIAWEDLSPQFTEVLAYAYRVIDSHPMVEDMVKILFPHPSDISAYGLLNSDLVQSAETPGVKKTSPGEKAMFFKEMLYESAFDVARKPLQAVLGLDYDEVLKESKEFKGQKALRGKTRNGQVIQFETILDATLYRFINGVFNFFFNIFSFFSPKSSAKKESESERDTLMGEDDFPEPRSAGGLPIGKAAEVFGVPSSRAELRDRIDRSLRDWNQIVLDPKVYYTDWGRYGYEDKERLKKKLQDETKTRMDQAREKVDKAIDRMYKNFDLSGVSAGKLNGMASDMAKQFRSRNYQSLSNYIRDTIIYRNTSD